MQVRKAPGGPTQHAGLDFIHGVPSWSRPKSANRVPAFSSVDLCSASDVKHRTCFDRLHAIDNVADNSSTHTETSVTSKIPNAFLEVVMFQSQISVELHDEFPVVATRRTKSIIKCIDNNAAGFSQTTVLPVNSADPGILMRVVINDASGVVRRSIIHNHPFCGANRLGQHAFDGEFQIGRFVANWSNHQIACAGSSRRHLS